MFYSPFTNSFYPESLRSSYEESGTWPDDAVYVTDEQWEKYALEMPPEGFKRGPDENGYPSWVRIPEDPPEVRRAHAIRMIDSKAGDVRSSFASFGSFIFSEYEQAEQQAETWITSGSPEDDVPPDVKSWADATGKSAELAARDITESARKWREMISCVRRLRLKAKQEVIKAPDDYDFYSIAESCMEGMESLCTGTTK